MMLGILDDVENIVAERLEIVPAAELIGTGLELII